MMGISNKIAYALGPIVLSAFMSLQGINVTDVVEPFYIISAIFLVGAGISFFAPLPEIQAGSSSASDEVGNESQASSVFEFPHLFLGTLALFLYIGVETLSLGTVLDFATKLELPHFNLFGINMLTPEMFVSYATFSMIIGYLAGIVFIPKYLSQQKSLMYSSVLGLVITVMVLVFPANWAVILVAALGIANAVMFPAIWPLSLARLGKFTKTGSSILVLGIVGGAILPLIFGWMADLISYQLAYWICLPGYLYILYFAARGHKIRKLVRSV
jgi:fucose permease